MSIIETGTLATRELAVFFTGSAAAFLTLPKVLAGRGGEIPGDVQKAAGFARTAFNETIQGGAAVASWARHSGTPLALPGFVADAAGREALRATGAGELNHAAMLGDLLTLFNQGPTTLVLGDLSAQAKREAVDLKRKLGLGLGAGDSAALLKAIDGINASRLYPRAYEFIYDHIRSLASEAALSTLNGKSIYAPTEALIALSKSFDKDRLPQTVAFLEAVAQDPDLARGKDFNRRLEAAMRQDGAGAYEYFGGKAWELIYTVAVKDTSVFLKDAVASIPEVEPYLWATMDNTGNYYDMLVKAPVFLRALVYISEANDKGHFLNGAHVAFPPATSEHASQILDGYLRTALDSAAGSHPFFSTNRAGVEAKNPVNAQKEFERAPGF